MPAYLSFPLYLLLTLLLMGVLVFVHELGHYVTARLCKVTIYEFSIGMGKRLGGFTSKKTGIQYSFRLLPIGGYVAMAGEDGGEEEAPEHADNAEDTAGGEAPVALADTDGTSPPVAADDPNAFNKKNVWQRILILSAGAAMNVLTGFLAMLVLTAGMTLAGYRLPSTTIAAYPDPGALSYMSGLRVGDRIIAIDGVKVHTGYDLSYEIMFNAYEPVDVVVERDGVRMMIEHVRFPSGMEEGIMLGSMDFRIYSAESSVSNVLKTTYWRSISSIKMVFDSIGGIITGRFTLASMSGPIGVTNAVADVASQPMAVWNILYLFALIAMNLGVLNMMPIPALDGGRVFFRILEIINFGKPIKASVENRIHGAAMALLLAMTAFIALKDIFMMF